jgi:hypothetical protein
MEHLCGRIGLSAHLREAEANMSIKVGRKTVLSFAESYASAYDTAGNREEHGRRRVQCSSSNSSLSH